MKQLGVGLEKNKWKLECLNLDFDEAELAILLYLQENVGSLDAAIEQLLNAEKHARLAGDVAATRNAVTEILRMCFEARAWKTLNDQIVLLSKRRGQLKQVMALCF